MTTSFKEKENDYRKAFDLDKQSSEKTVKALEYALDIRKFEIELYWKRGTYFWTLIAATFAGYFAVLTTEKIEYKLFAYVLACIGFIFTLAWFLVNRGSKFWQENWENHVDMLEDTICGPLYKTVLRRPRPKSTTPWWRKIDGPAPISVSKINQWVSLFTLLIWPVLIYEALPPFSCSAPISYKHVCIISLVIGVSALMLCKSRSTSETSTDYQFSVSERKSSIIDNN